jgi:hypothetical protein
MGYYLLHSPHLLFPLLNVIGGEVLVSEEIPKNGGALDLFPQCGVTFNIMISFQLEDSFKDAGNQAPICSFKCNVMAWMVRCLFRCCPQVGIQFCAFGECSALASFLEIPGSVIRIEDLAFSRCESLQAVRMSVSSRLSSIARAAFVDCPLLTDIDVGRMAVAL